LPSGVDLGVGVNLRFAMRFDFAIGFAITPRVFAYKLPILRRNVTESPHYTP
jgi:hypothetical protein